MTLEALLGLGQTALELGLISALTVLSLFLSYSMLNVCDLSTDGTYTLGAVVGAVVAMTGHPWLSIPAAMGAGALSGLLAALLQTKMGVNSLLAGIIVNTGLYSVNMAIMQEKAVLNLFRTETVFTAMKGLLEQTPFSGLYKLAVSLAAVGLVSIFLALFLRTRLGLAIRATGNNPGMVRSSSINSALTSAAGLCISNAITALSGCLLAQSQKSVSIDMGSGILTVALASLLIGSAFLGRGRIPLRILGAILGAVVFRLVFALALRFSIPAFMLKAVSSVIVIAAISGPYLKSQWPQWKRRMSYRREGTQC